MSKEEILQSNKRIAEFMGLTIITDGISFFDTNYKFLKKYESSWNELMPVVEKIESISVGNFKGVYKLRIDPWNVAITDYTNLSEDDTEDIVEVQRDDSTLLDDVYFCVVAFIKWKNKNL